MVKYGGNFIGKMSFESTRLTYSIVRLVLPKQIQGSRNFSMLHLTFKMESLKHEHFLKSLELISFRNWMFTLNLSKILYTKIFSWLREKITIWIHFICLFFIKFHIFLNFEGSRISVLEVFDLTAKKDWDIDTSDGSVKYKTFVYNNCE